MSLISYLALQEFETSTATRANVAQLVLGTVLGNDGGGISTANNDDCPIPRGFYVGLKERRGSFCKGGKFEHTGRPTLYSV